MQMAFVPLNMSDSLTPKRIQYFSSFTFLKNSALVIYSILFHIHISTAFNLPVSACVKFNNV